MPLLRIRINLMLLLFPLLTLLQVVAYFWAGWCEPCKLLDEVLTELERSASSICCLRIEAEECPEISGQCNVAVVPLFLFFSNSTEVDRLEGADAAALTEKFSKFYPAANAFSGPSELPSDNKDEVATYSLTNILKDLVNRDPIMLFMKGTPDHPQCGFSAKVVDALRASGSTSFGHFNILEDDEVRQGLKEFSNWPTYPQLYVNGDLVGGCDIIMEMAQSGELKQELEKATKGDQGVGKDSLDERIQKLIHEKPVMLFMKGLSVCRAMTFIALALSCMRV